MRTIKYIIAIILMITLGMSAKAQQRNVLQIPEVSVNIGKVELPISVENTDEITGIQFDITLPQGVTAENQGRLTNRGENHSITLNKMGSGAYRVIIYSSSNSRIQGQSGVVAYLPIQIPSSFEEGSEHAVSINNATLGKASGQNVLTDVLCGKIRVSKLPDFTVKNVICNKKEFSPNEVINVSWQVENVGKVSAGGGWTEQISLVSENGKQQKLIATTHCDEILAADDVSSRQTEIRLPFLLGIDGKAYVQVRVVPDKNAGESTTAQENNTIKSNGYVIISKSLELSLSRNQIDENNKNRISLEIKRSGDWSKTETFSLNVTNDDRVTIPTSISIPANQSGSTIYFQIADNDIVDENDSISFVASGNGYSETKTVLHIEDNEHPTLGVSASVTDVVEGESFNLIVSLPRPSANPVTLSISCDNARRFDFNKQIEIPIGETSVQLPVTVVDNDEIEMDDAFTFMVSSDKYEKGDCYVFLHDNDMPTFTFSLSPEAVSESDGYSALFGKITRTDNLNKRVTIKLSDDSNGLLSYSNKTIVLEKNQSAVQFNIGVLDNDIVDGNHTVTVTAAVYSSSCDCSAPTDTKGHMTTTITVIDDDGPTVKIKPAGTSMLEGSDNNIFVVSHNVNPENDVVVRISSDSDDILEYEHEVTIPAGQSSVNVTVKVKDNDTQDDSKLVTFKAEANNYSLGTCWILITDQTLPDAIVTLSTEKSSVEAEQTILLTATVKNVGNSNLRSTTSLDFSFSGSKEKGKVNIGKSVAPGDSVTVEYNYLIPAITGTYTFEATVNADGKVPELIYSNNSSEKVKIDVLSPFALTAKADKDIYVQNDSVRISGTASGVAGKNANVEVYIINEGVRQTLNAITNDNGEYSVVYKLLSKQCGNFTIGACYPGSKETEAMDEFDVYGLTAKSKKGGYSFEKCEMSDGDTYEGAIVISNPGNLAQTGLSITPKAESANCLFNFSVPNTVGAGETVEIPYTIKADSISGGNQYQELPVIISSENGANLNYTLYYYVYPLKAKLQSNKTYISTTMTHGVPREYPITIKNIGRAETGKITLSLPSWIQTTTSSEMASLAQGDSTTIVLKFMPTDAMKLNVRVSGSIGINCANGDGTSISFNLTPVSESKGTLKVNVVDEYTFFTNEAPHVNKAKVSIKNPSTNEIVAEGETTSEGTFVAELPEGYYSIAVDADKHDSYTNTVIVDPGSEKTEEVFLSYQAITYSWNVEETTVEDEYEIETIVKYETRVPKPVVIVTLPDEQPEPNSIIPVIITNKGLVNAVDVNMSLSISNGYTLEFINDPTLDVLAPQQAHVFYAKMVPNGANEAKARMAKASGYSKCYTLIARAKYKELCKKYTGEELAEAIKKWGTRECLSSSSHRGGGGSYGPGYPSLWGNNNYGSSYRIDDMDDPARFCDKVLNDGEDGDDDNNIPDPNEDVPEADEELENCDDKPTFAFYLTSVEGRKKRHGVAADGLSQIKIVLGKETIKPKDDCDYTYKWTLSPEIGELSNETSLEDVIYTAPKNFPSVTGNKYTVEATLTYTKDGISAQAPPVKIEIIRVPLALIHGLNSSDECWMNYYKHLLDLGLYKDWQIKNVDYSQTHNSHFTVNYRCATNAINKLKSSCLKEGYEVTQVDLVGHSMGGILSRFHVQRGGKKDGHSDVHKLITVNTPHSGSEIGDIATIDPKFAKAAWLAGFRPLDAVHDLAVNSSAIDNDLNGSMRTRGVGVPVYAIVTTSKSTTFGAGTIMHILRKIVGMYNHTLEYALYLNDSDAIVSRESQEGGCETVASFDGLCHTDSPEDRNNVWPRLTSLLGASTDIFSTNWFNPIDRKFIPIPLPNEVLPLSPSRDAGSNMQYSKLDIEAMTNNDSLFVTIDKNNLFKEHLIIASYDDNNIYYSDTTTLKSHIPTTFAGDIKIVAICKASDGNMSIDSTFINVAKTKADIVSIVEQDICITRGDSMGIYVEVLWSDGNRTYEVPDMVNIDEQFANYNNGKVIGLRKGISTILLGYKGLTSSSRLIVCNEFGDKEDVDDEDSDDSPSICSTITLSFKQKSVMTRQAFRGTLTVNNGHETVAMQDIKLNLEVRDMNGNVATSHEFQIDAETLDGFVGNLDVKSGWRLEGGKTGTATILFIPTKYAAPTEPKDYAFGGSFSYKDPYTGLVVTRDLNPVTLTVNPSPNLEMTYFMQRDVFGDDPLTEAIEPMKPSEFALIVNNKGYGDAENMKLTTRQPEIIDNQKGLAISFELISTQLNGQEKTMSLGGSMTSDFGNIPAQSQAYAQWWLQSSLLGHFIEYDIKATHLTSHDNPDLSLLDTVTIHELIHGFTVESTGEKPLRGFLVNDIKDREDLPDGIYFTDATHADAYIASSANIVKKSDTEYSLTVNASSTGWNYVSILDPTNGKQALAKIVSSDGKEINLDNIWQTDRTLRDGKDPLYENRLHFIGNISGNSEVFNLTFEPKPEVELEVESYSGVPEEGHVLKEQLTSITVKFNKPIQSESFTNEDITVTCQGVAQDVSVISVEQLNDTEYKMLLNDATLFDGYYVLTVQTAGITDNEGFNGSQGKQASWIQFVDGKVALKVVASPMEGGSITPGSGRFDYNTNVTLTATPSEGYEFVGWSENNENISSDNELSYFLEKDTELKALFTSKYFDVSIEYDAEQGSILGGATGIFPYGEEIHLRALPNSDYAFDGWIVNGELVSMNSEFTITVNSEQKISATFKRLTYQQEIKLQSGWNWVSTYLNEPLAIETIVNDLSNIVGQFAESIEDPEYGMVGDIYTIEPGHAYKLNAKQGMTSTYIGRIHNIQEKPIMLNTGWNWISYPYAEERDINDVLSNASEGDYMTSQFGFSEFVDGYWEGTLNTLTPGYGYIYKSSTNKTLEFDFSNSPSIAKVTRANSYNEEPYVGEVDAHKYPSTMNVIARISTEAYNVAAEQCRIYAFAGNELRGESRCVGDNHYLTIYGDNATDITFVVENTMNGDTYFAKETVTFRSDVLGSRKAPFNITISGTTAINDITDSSRKMKIYSIEGILINSKATTESLKKLSRGIYIIDGQKFMVK